MDSGTLLENWHVVFWKMLWDSGHWTMGLCEWEMDSSNPWLNGQKLNWNVEWTQQMFC